MQILNSEWLIKMLEKSGTTPEARILNLFNILSDWLDAPQINSLIQQGLLDNTQPKLLLSYLTNEAKKMGSPMPEVLAEQLIFLASSALNTQIGHTKNESLDHAKHVAKALIDAQCERKSIYFSKSKSLSALVILLGIITISIYVFKIQGTNLTLDPIAKNDASTALSEMPMLTQANNPPETNGNPKNTADMYASIETMRGGDCQFIEVLQIPDADKKIYLEDVVGGQVPTNAHDQMIAQHYMQKIRCNYTPKLMKNSTN
jgi:hypothetical protein